MHALLLAAALHNGGWVRESHGCHDRLQIKRGEAVYYFMHPFAAHAPVDIRQTPPECSVDLDTQPNCLSAKRRW